MTVHHATIKSAKKAGFAIEADDDGVVTVTDKKARFEVQNTGKPGDILKQAITLRMYHEEYPMLQIGATDDGSWAFWHEDDEESGPTYTVDADPEKALAIWLERCAEHGFETDTPEPEYDVVPGHYKAKYAEGGHPTHCGDWLAEWLDGRFKRETTVVEVNKKGEDVPRKKALLDVEAFSAFLEENGVDMTKGKWVDLPNSGQKGWEGRYRMNGRQKLEIEVVRNGALLHNGEVITPDAGWLAEMQEKHPGAYTEWYENVGRLAEEE